jgi:uncharacterized membrane protein
MARTFTKKTLLIALLLSVFCIVGVSLRFCNLQGQIYWDDEVTTSIRVAGFSERDAELALSSAGTVMPNNLLRYQHHDVSRTQLDTVHSCSSEDPHVPPLYYLILRGWAAFFGDSPAAFRTVSAIFSALCLPATFLFSYMLFRNYLVAFIAMVLISVSPMQIEFAREARSYALASFLFLISGSLLIDLLMGQNRKWLIRVPYFLANVLGIYCQPLFFLVLLAQALFVALYRKSFARANVRNFFIALILSLSMFAPWLFVMIMGAERVQHNTRWLSYSLPGDRWWPNWTLNLVRMFADWPHLDILALLSLLFVVFFTVVFVLWGCREKRTQLGITFLTLSVVVCSVPLMGADLICGGIRGIIPRYFLPCYICLTVMVAFALGQGVQRNSRFVSISASSLFVLLACLGCLSGNNLVNSRFSWIKPTAKNAAMIAGILNELPSPLLIKVYSDSDSDLAPLISAAYLMKPSVRIKVFFDPKQIVLPNGFENLLLLNPSSDDCQKLRQQYACDVVPVDRTQQLWLVRPRSRALSHEADKS